MRTQETEASRRRRVFPAGVPRLSGLRSQMTLICIGVVLVFMAFVLIVRLCVFFILQEPRVDLTPSKIIGTVVTPIAIIIGILTGLAASRGPVARMKRLVAATTAFAAGNSAERVRVSRMDEIGQLEHQFNEMAQQLVESAAQQRMLVEQNARLAERTRISRDLHDSVKQRLFAVALQVGVALSLAETADARVRQHLQEADGLIAQAQQDLTALIHELRPAALQQKGLPAALRDFAANWSRQHAIPVEITLADISGLSFETEEALWHITGEAFSNIARHSGATRAGLRLDATPTQVKLDISDNGHGFAPAATGNATGVGLQSMRERLDAVGGTLTIESGSVTGTRVVACCPLAAVGGALPADGAAGETTRARNEALL